MKKRNLLSLLMLATLTLASCGGDNSSVDNNNSTNSENTVGSENNSVVDNNSNTENNSGSEDNSESDNNSNTENNSGSENVEEKVHIDFTSITETSGVKVDASADGALATFQGFLGDNASSLVSFEATNIYYGTGTSGAHPNTAGILKMGKSAEDGVLKMTFADSLSFTKVTLSCHDFYAISETYPTNSNRISINGSAAVLAPYTSDGTATDLTFDITASNVIEITASKRVYVWSISLS